jgi:hypothetical protein
MKGCQPACMSVTRKYWVLGKELTTKHRIHGRPALKSNQSICHELMPQHARPNFETATHGLALRDITGYWLIAIRSS